MARNTPRISARFFTFAGPACSMPTTTAMPMNRIGNSVPIQNILVRSTSMYSRRAMTSILFMAFPHDADEDLVERRPLDLERAHADLADERGQQLLVARLPAQLDGDPPLRARHAAH